MTTTSRLKQRLVDYNSGVRLVSIKKFLQKKRFSNKSYLKSEQRTKLSHQMYY